MNDEGAPLAGYVLALVCSADVATGLVRQEVMRQVLPRNASAVDVDDRVEDLPQLMPRGPPFFGAGASGSPGRDDRFDQGPSGIGDITAVRATSHSRRRAVSQP
jgi:hypothetical protein